MATAPTYCTHRQLKDVFPQVDSFDNKRPLYGWVQEAALNDFGSTSNLNIWYAYNTGLVTQLFKDGVEITNLTSNLDSNKTLLNGNITSSATAAAVDSSTGIEVNDIIKINNEYMKVSAVPDGVTIGFSATRNLFNTHSIAHSDDSKVYLVLDEGNYDASDYNWFYYDKDLDLCVLAMPDNLNPNDTLMQAGEDFSTLITRITANASRYLDSKLDPNLPKEQFKDKEGNYDYIIIRTTALLAATFLIRSHDPTSEIANSLMEDAQSNIDALNKGNAALSWQTTGDSSKGVLRDVTYTSGSIRPVDTRGRWSGSWDLIKIKITTGGVLGTAKYSVFIKDDNKLKNHEAVSSEVITGDYQALAGGLQIRFAGSADDSTAAINDEWEMEVTGWSEEVDNSQINSVKMTRGGYGMYRKTRTFGKY